MNESPELVFEFSRNGKLAGMTVTAKIGDDVLHCDRLDIAKAKQRDDFVDSICKDRPGIRRADVKRVLLAHAAAEAKRQREKDNRPDQPDAEALLEKMPEHVRREARSMLESPDLSRQVLADVAATGVAGERELTAAIYLVGVSRLLPKPLATIVQAPSSTGKSYTVGKVADLFPPESVILATSLTPQALFYMPPGSLVHKWIVAGERSRREDDESAEATRALREMISSGKLTKLIPTKDKDGGFTTQKIEQDGPIAYIETTTLSKIFDEDANRCLLLSADERTQQTTAIVNRLAGGYGGAEGIDVEAIIARHHALQRMLQQRPVVIPFAEKIAERFPTDRVEARRAFPHLMAMIQASALLHQYQRPLDGDGRIVASPDDYQLARHLARGPLARLLGGSMSDAALRFYDRLAGWASDKFTTAEAYRRDRKSQQAVRGWLRELCEAGGVDQVEPPKGSRPAVWKLTDVAREELAIGDCGLPSVEEIS